MREAYTGLLSAKTKKVAHSGRGAISSFMRKEDRKAYQYL